MYSYHAYFILLLKIERHVTERNKRLDLWSIFISSILGNPVLNSSWLNHWKWLLPDPMHGSWNFLSHREDLDCFLQPEVLPKFSEIIVTCPKSINIQQWEQFLHPHSQKNDYQFWNAQCSKSAKWNLDYR